MNELAVPSALFFLASLLACNYSREPPTTRDITFDTSGWTESERSESRIVWMTEKGDILLLELGDATELPLGDQDALLRHIRSLAESNGGGIVSCDVVFAGSIQAVKLIYKKEERTGYMYTGMLIVPVESVSFVIASVHGEHGMTGVREAVVSAELAEKGELELETFERPDESGATGRIRGWFKNPYDPSYEGIILHCIADDEKYDGQFPDHPLTLLRHTLERIRQTLKIDERVLGFHKLPLE